MSDPCLSSQPTQSHRTSMPMSFVAGQGVVGRSLWRTKWPRQVPVGMVLSGHWAGAGGGRRDRTLCPCREAGCGGPDQHRHRNPTGKCCSRSLSLKCDPCMGSGPPRADCECRASLPPRAPESEPDCKETPRDVLHAESREALIRTKCPHLSSGPITETGLGACPKGQTCPLILPPLPHRSPAHTLSFFLTSQPPAP